MARVTTTAITLDKRVNCRGFHLSKVLRPRSSSTSCPENAVFIAADASCVRNCHPVSWPAASSLRSIRDYARHCTPHGGTPPTEEIALRLETPYCEIIRPLPTRFVETRPRDCSADTHKKKTTCSFEVEALLHLVRMYFLSSGENSTAVSAVKKTRLTMGDVRG